MVLVAMKPRYNTEKWYIENRAKDEKKNRFCHKIHVCPCNVCDAAQFKNAKLWSWEDEETVREYLMAHLVWDKCHELSLAEAEVLAMEAVVDCTIESYEDREKERLKWEATEEKARAKKEAKEAAEATRDAPADAGGLGLQDCNQAKSGGKHSWHPNNYDWNHNQYNKKGGKDKGGKGKGGNGKGGKDKGGKDKGKESSFAEVVENVAQLN